MNQDNPTDRAGSGQAGFEQTGSGQAGSACCENTARQFCHRCRNDLSTVWNLISIRAPYAKNPMDLANSMEGRITALSMAYNRAATPANHALTLRDLAEDICNRALAMNLNGHSINNRLPRMELGLRLASPLAMWLYEILANAASHGCGHAGHAEVELSGDINANELVISVMDQGHGLPPGFDLCNHARAGLKVAQAVSEFDLKAQMELIPSSPGLCVELVAPIDEINCLNKMR